MTYNQKVYLILAAALVAFWSTVIGLLTWSVISYFNGGW